MSLIVQKFGGSSVADTERLLHISRMIRDAFRGGDDVIVVVSAQGDTTDRLIKKSQSISGDHSLREMDALLSTGEQMSSALTAIALESIGVPAVSLSAWQIPLHTDGAHGDARIDSIGRARIERELNARRVVVCAGFQGIDDAGDVTTLGRGGSDYTAVALAAEFNARRCLIYTDVDGVYTADPRLCPTARRLKRVSYEDMYALARAGARVLHDKCVALAQRRGVEPEVCSSYGEKSEGTRIGPTGESSGVAGVTRRVDEADAYAAVTIVGKALPSLSLERRALLALDSAGIAVEGIDEGERALTIYVPRVRSREALCVVHDAIF